MQGSIEKYLKIKLFLTDVDGVLTDAGMYYTETGDELKKFCTLDGGGLMLLKQVGIQTGFLTSEDTRIVQRRAQKLQVEFVIQGVKNKLKSFIQLIEKLGLTPQEAAYIGDDINDLKILEQVGVSATVPGNCLPEGFTCDYVTQCEGGSGAVRDFAEWLLRQRGEYEKALSSYLKKMSSN